MSKKYPKNLQVRNESLINKKFISGEVPCEVSVVVKNSASVKECGAQNQNLFFILKIIKIRREVICFKCKMSKQWKCVVSVNSVQQLKICAKIKFLFEWPVYFFFQSLS